VDATTAKCITNSTISTPDAKCRCLDIKNFYLGTPMDRYEYMWLPLEIIPEEIMKEYELHKLVHNGCVYLEVQNRMYGLLQAGILANKLLTEQLATKGYMPCHHTPGLWKHKWQPVWFSLVVDDFGVKYIGKQHTIHLVDILKEWYEVSEDWDGTRYCGITIEWDYVN
jgi:hypothetical protein